MFDAVEEFRAFEWSGLCLYEFDVAPCRVALCLNVAVDVSCCLLLRFRVLLFGSFVDCRGVLDVLWILALHS